MQIHSRSSRLSKQIAIHAHLCDEIETPHMSAFHSPTSVVENQQRGLAHNHHNGSHDSAPIVTVITKKRKIIIHDSDSDDVSDCPTAVRTTTSDDRTLLHPNDCTCTRCADNCKYLDNSAQHVGTDSSGTTGSSESDDSNSFICTEDEMHSEAEAKMFKKMFPISAKIIMRKQQEVQPKLGVIGSELTIELACQLACEAPKAHNTARTEAVQTVAPTDGDVTVTDRAKKERTLIKYLQQQK
jgi:hypothetical protein